MYFHVNFNVFLKLIKVHLLVSELYIYQNTRCNKKKPQFLAFPKRNQVTVPATISWDRFSFFVKYHRELRPKKPFNNVIKLLTSRFLFTHTIEHISR